MDMFIIYRNNKEILFSISLSLNLYTINSFIKLLIEQILITKIIFYN